MVKVASNGMTEIILQEEYLSVERLKVPNGYLYITRYIDGDAAAVATSFVPYDEKELGVPF